MPSGLAALLDDIATITKVAAASIDDVAAAAGKASTKAAGVVIDDTAVTPQYVTGFTPDRELPIIWRIAKGSLVNKLVFILPAALLLSYFAPWLITPILMVGGAYLCFEGAEKVYEKFRDATDDDEETLAEEVAELSSADHEKNMVSGAVRTDFILSAEIMAIALKEVADQYPSIAMQGAALFIVAIGITIAVYGVVGLIVKMDDIGLNMAQRKLGATRAIGRALGAGHAKAAVISVDRRHSGNAVGWRTDHRSRVRLSPRRMVQSPRRRVGLASGRGTVWRCGAGRRRCDCRGAPLVGASQSALRHQHRIHSLGGHRRIIQRVMQPSAFLARQC